MKQYMVNEDQIKYLETLACQSMEIPELRFRPYHHKQDIEVLKKAIIEVLDTGFVSSELDIEVVLDRIDAWENGELQPSKQETVPQKGQHTITRGDYLKTLSCTDWKTTDNILSSLNIPLSGDAYHRLTRSLANYCKLGVVEKKNQHPGKCQYYRLTKDGEPG